MLKALKWLFVGDAHSHRWKILREVAVYEPGAKKAGGLPHRTEYITQCTICGKVKRM